MKVDESSIVTPRHILVALRRAQWHRPLLLLAAAMVLLGTMNLIGVIFDARQVTGVELWLKPLKFAISTAIYATTLSWFIGRVPVARKKLARIARAAGTIAAIGLAIELVIINGFALFAQTSHFNVSTPFHAAMWGVMAVSIGIVWSVTFIVAIILFKTPLGDSARTVAIRAGVIIALIGMALAGLMTGPTATQLSNYQGVVGAHTVGLADGGPGLPFFGWSTVGGDLRIPHFVGMHALQALPILVIALELLAIRIPLLRHSQRRLRIVILGVIVYALTLVTLTTQALIGQSIIAPSGIILVGGISIALFGLVDLIVIIAAPIKK